jgi:hypothetical protein
MTDVAPGADAQIAPTPAEAGARLETLLADRSFADRLLKGDGPAVTEFRSLMERKSEASGDHLTDVIQGTAKAPDFQLTVDGELNTRAIMDGAAALREFGVSDGAIRELLENKPVTRAEWDALQHFRRSKLGDQEWSKKLLAGDYQARKELALMGIISVCGYSE